MQDTQSRYQKTINGKEIDAVRNTNKRQMKTMQTLTKTGIITEGKITVDGVEITLGYFDLLDMNQQARKLLDILLVRVTPLLPYGKNATRPKIAEVFDVEISLDEYMKLCGLSDRKNAREQFRAAAKTLFYLYMNFHYERWIKPENARRMKKEIKHYSYHLFEGTTETHTPDTDPFVNSRIVFRFSIGLLEYLCSRYIMPVNIKIFMINPRRNPHAYNLAYKMTEHYNQNTENNNPVRLSVKSLLAVCPELPTVDEIQEGARQLTKRISEPFERDLDALVDVYGIIQTWHYCHKGGEPLSDEELTNYNFEQWLDFLIEFNLPDYPKDGGQKARIRAKITAARHKSKTKTKK